jgi:hypothetical protein
MELASVTIDHYKKRGQGTIFTNAETGVRLLFSKEYGSNYNFQTLGDNAGLRLRNEIIMSKK